MVVRGTWFGCCRLERLACHSHIASNISMTNALAFSPLHGVIQRAAVAAFLCSNWHERLLILASR